jgi:hypothetical protein
MLSFVTTIVVIVLCLRSRSPVLIGLVVLTLLFQFFPYVVFGAAILAALTVALSERP